MAGFFASLLPGLADGLLGKLFKPKEKAPGVDYSKLRRDAERAGFNPLTALLAGGGAGYQRQAEASMSGGAFLRDIIERGVDTAFDSPPENHQAKQIRAFNDAVNVRDEVRKSDITRRFGLGLTDTVPFGVQQAAHRPMSAKAERPVSREFIGPRQPVKVRHAVSGQWIGLDPGVADRLGVGAGDALIAEDYEAVFGDVPSEVMATGAVADGVYYGVKPMDASGLGRASPKTSVIFGPTKPPVIKPPGFKYVMRGGKRMRVPKYGWE